MTLRSKQDAALEPVRTALISSAGDRAATAVARARDEAAALLARAGADADDAVAAAAAAGAADARLVAAAELSKSRRAARAVALGAEFDAYNYIAGRIRTAVLALRDDDGYPLLRRRLAEMALRSAGPSAQVTDHPDGGVVATAPGVVVDCSLGRLAERAIGALEAQIVELCRRQAGPAAREGAT